MDQRLNALLNAPEKDRQFLGLQLCAKSMDVDAVPAITRIISAGDPDTSQLAISTAVLISKTALLDKPRNISRESFFAAVAVLKKFAPDFSRFLIDRLEELDNVVVIDALITLRHFISVDRAQDVMKRHGKTPDSRIRATLVKHIGPVVGQRAPDTIAKFLDDNDPRVRANALEALEAINNKLFLRVIQRYKTDPVPRIRANTAKAMVVYGDLSYLQIIEGMLGQVDKIAFRLSAIWTIGEIGRSARDSFPLLRIVADDKNVEIRRHLKLLLDKVGMIPDVDFLRHIIKEELKDQIKAGIVKKSETRFERVRKADYLLCGIYGSLTVEKLLPIKFTFQEMENQQDVRVIINCTYMDFIDSSGASMFANITKRFAQKGGFLRLFGCNERILELFQVTGLDYVLSIHPDEDTASKVQ
ncbi:MAG: HEAT repeat domain-containing protein [Fibrobacteres bacterium]|nr:HEAT repeat domain-containing protein [Fibrobacterota bacterium]